MNIQNENYWVYSYSVIPNCVFYNTLKSSTNSLKPQITFNSFNISKKYNTFRIGEKRKNKLVWSPMKLGKLIHIKWKDRKLPFRTFLLCVKQNNVPTILCLSLLHPYTSHKHLLFKRKLKSALLLSFVLTYSSVCVCIYTYISINVHIFVCMCAFIPSWKHWESLKEERLNFFPNTMNATL